MKIFLNIAFAICIVTLPKASASQISEKSSSTSSKTNSLISFIPEQARSLATRAEEAFASGDLKQAESFYKQSLDYGPNNPPLLVSLAAVETRMGKLDDSEKLLQQALHLDLKNSPAWLLLGMNYLEEKRNDEAFAALVQAALYDDHNPRAHNYLGIAAGRKGWNEVSEDELRRAIDLDPQYADANFNLAVLYLRRTPPLIELGRRHYQQALDLGSPKDPVIEAQLAKEAPPSNTSSVQKTEPETN
jgi:tetratricopeptide (TPR) repeat protein